MVRLAVGAELAKFCIASKVRRVPRGMVPGAPITVAPQPLRRCGTLVEAIHPMTIRQRDKVPQRRAELVGHRSRLTA
jgi:hypothetical protein